MSSRDHEVLGVMRNIVRATLEATQKQGADITTAVDVIMSKVQPLLTVEYGVKDNYGDILWSTAEDCVDRDSYRDAVNYKATFNDPSCAQLMKRLVSVEVAHNG